MHRLFRASIFHQSGTSPSNHPSRRNGSPAAGCSTLTTSAPKSASRVASQGPAPSVAMSTTFTPSSGAVTV